MEYSFQSYRPNAVFIFPQKGSVNQERGKQVIEDKVVEETAVHTIETEQISV